MTSRASTFDPHCAAMTLERRSPSHFQCEKKVLWLFEHPKSNQYKQGGQGTKRSITCWKVMATPTSRCQAVCVPPKYARATRTLPSQVAKPQTATCRKQVDTKPYVCLQWMYTTTAATHTAWHGLTCNEGTHARKKVLWLFEHLKSIRTGAHVRSVRTWIGHATRSVMNLCCCSFFVCCRQPKMLPQMFNTSKI